jgi:hypothetical protein
MKTIQKLVAAVAGVALVGSPVAALAAPAPYSGPSVVESVDTGKGDSFFGVAPIFFILGFVVIGGVIIIAVDDSRSNR